MVNHNAFAQRPPPALFSLGCMPPDLQWSLGKKLRAPGVVEDGRRKGCWPSAAELVPRLPLQESQADLGPGACVLLCKQGYTS